jgi:quercetin dioxygenase-like cupin family protein
MERKKFLLIAAAAIPAILIGQNVKNPKPKRQKKGFIVKAGDARMNAHTPFMGVNPNDLKISSKDTDGALSVFEYTGTQKVGPALHVHYYQDEIFYVVEGDYLFQLGTEKYKLKAGDTIFLPRNIPHTWIQLSDNGKLIYFLQPAGKMEEFFIKMSTLKGKPTDEEIQKITMEHGMKNIGPPLQL